MTSTASIWPAMPLTACLNCSAWADISNNSCAINWSSIGSTSAFTAKTCRKFAIGSGKADGSFVNLHRPLWSLHFLTTKDTKLREGIPDSSNEDSGSQFRLEQSEKRAV